MRVDGQRTFNSGNPTLQAALDGFGLAYLPLGQVQSHIECGRLVQVLSDWTLSYSG